MLVIPAIDLKDGRCVRLRQGDMAAETVYSEDVPAVAQKWREATGCILSQGWGLTETSPVATMR